MSWRSMLWAWLGLLVASTQLKEARQDVPVLPALGIRFADEDLQKGVIAGPMYIRSPTDFSGSPTISYFSVYWGSDASTKLVSQALVSVNVAPDIPLCTGTSCSSITITPDSTTPSTFIISRGESGYSNNERAEILLVRGGTVTLTFFGTESYYDTLTIGGHVFSGSIAAGEIIEVSAGSMIIWDSDYSETRDGWSLTFQSQVAAMQEVNVSSTTIPAGASHFLVYSGNANGEMASPLSAPIRDMYVLPSPLSLSFTDSSSTAHFVSGLLQLGEPSDVSDILRYDVYWGNHDGRWGACSATIGYRFEPGPNLTRECSGNWGNNFLSLLPIAAESVAGPEQVGGFGLRFDGSFLAQTIGFMVCLHTACYGSTAADWSVAAWINPSVQPAAGSYILSKGSAEYGLEEFSLFLNSDFTLSCSFFETESVSCTSTQALTRNAWAHALCTRETAGSVTELRLYLNGALSISCTSQVATTSRSYGKLVIGGGLSGQADDTFFDGLLDEVAIFEYSLTAAEVSLLYNGDRLSTWLPGETTSMELNSAPRPGARTLVAVSVGEFLESEPLVIPLVDLATPVNLPLAVSFTDTDPTAGSYGGVVLVTRASDESDLSRYVAYWGSSATTKLTDSVELGDVDVANESSSEVSIHLSIGLIPPGGASHIVVVSSINIPPATGESSQGVGVLLSDYAPPSVIAQAVSFSDTNPVIGTVSGNVLVTGASNENGIVSYNLYFADDSATPLELILKLPVASTLSLTLTDVVIPANATSILVLLEGAGGEATAGVSSTSLDALDAPSGIEFQDLDPLAGTIQGVVTIQRAVLEVNVQSYEVYWAQGSSQLQLLESLPWSSLPVTLVMEMYDSYGDGWNGADYNIYGASGTLIASGTLSEGSFWSAIITVPAETLSITITGGYWPAEISWILKYESGGIVLSSDGSQGTFPVNFEFTVSGGTGGTGTGRGPFEVQIAAGTTAPAGADTLLAFCAFEGGASLAATTPLVDWSPPSGYPTSLAFSDTDGGVGIIAGQITVGRATDETGISEYKIYFGTSSSSKVPSAQAIASISTSVDPLVATLPATTVPTTASYLLAFSSSSSGENPQMAFLEISDLQRPTSPPSNVIFTDIDPVENSYAGLVSFSRAQDEAAITDYRCYWGSSSSAPDFRFAVLGSVAVSDVSAIHINSTEAPAGMTHLVVVSANGAYSMSTGSGVLPVDYATVTVTPSSFEFLDTDVLLGSIGGVATIGAASDESSVVDYAVYWGLTSTVKMPGGSPGLTAEFFTLTSCPSTSSFVDFSSLDSPYLTRHDNVSQYSSSRPGGSFSIWPGLSGSELFAARWTGWIQVISAANYWIIVQADDGSKLIVDGVEAPATGMGSEHSVHLTSGFHDIELQYFQCFGSSYLSARVSGPDTNYMYTSLWSFARTGVREQAPVATAPKTGSTVAATILGTAIPAGATHLVAFARAAGGLDSVFSIGTDLVDLVKPSVTAGTLQFSDADPSHNMIQGVLTIGRAQDETNLNSYMVYWGSSETQIVDSTTRRLQASGLGLVPSCSGVTCPQILIYAGTNDNEWIVSRGSYESNEQAFITLTGPAEVEFTFLSTETCCDKLFFPDTAVISGYTPPGLISLPDGVHSIEWSSDWSVQSTGWSFVYKYFGSASNSPGLIAMIPKPSTAQALAVLIEQQAMAGTHFIVKTAYDSTESENSVAIEVVDSAPPVVTVGEVTFVDTNHAAGVISGSVTIAAGSSEITGYNIYWGRDSNNTISMGNPGLLGEYFYLSTSPISMPTLTSSPDVVQVEMQLDVAETTSAWPGLTSSDLFAARWTGFIDIATSGTYSFTLSSNDGSQLYVNDALIVDNDGVHQVQSVTSEGVYLLPGLQSLQVLFFNAYGSYSIRLEYNGPDTSNYRQAVPSSVLRHGSLSNALIGSVAASGESVFQIENLEIPQEASHILVRGSTAAGEGASSSSVVIRDAFPPAETATAVHFTDVDPTAGQISGSIVVEVAANQSSISHYVIYWGSSATNKLGSNPLVQLSATVSSSGHNCGVKGPDSTPLRVSRRGVNGPKIVNGQTATECEWRWQASLRYASNDHHFCGGTLIAPRWVMTAAHCTEGSGPFVVTLGDFNQDSSEGHARNYDVLRVINHDNYNSDTMTHDFALIELSEEVEMGDCVATACLPEAEVAADVECFITGWGTLSAGGSTPSELQEGLVRIVSNRQCNAGYAGEILPDMLCAQGTASGGIVDACQGDSGGPLVCVEGGRYVLHGATSWGYGCAQAQFPGVWSRISYVMPWVIEQTGIEPGIGGNITYNISSESIPSSATHLLVYTAMNGVEMTTGISIPLVDFAPVQAVPASISFTDTDASPGELGGTITLGRAADESQVVGYAVYWGTASTVFVEILQVPKGSGGDVELQLPANTVIPSAATHLLGFVTSSSGTGASFVSVLIVDLDSSAVPGGLTFQDTDPAAMEIGGTVTVQRAAASTGITAYNLYFSSGSCTSLAQIVSLPGSGGGSVPNCLEGNACSSITISEETPGTYSISRGMGGYENNEHAIIQVHGPGIVEFTRFDTEPSYDTLRVEEATFSGTDLPGIQMLGEGMKVIEWNSDISMTGQGWALAFTPESTFGDIIYNLPSGTAIPSGANSMMVVSQTTAGETDCASTALVDFAPPSVAAQALWFTDENPSAGLVAGPLTILQARSHDGVSEYRIYWGMNSTTPMAGSSILFAVPAADAGTNLTVTLNATSLPANASHLLVFAASNQGQSLAAASAEVMDYAPAQDSAQAVNFTDVDPRVGFVAGTAVITRALDESTIEYYNLYFSSGQSKISFIGFMEAESLTARPSCSGLSCSNITITEVAGKYQVSRGTSSYGDEEFASIQVSGPGRVLFTYLNTESGYDFVTILGISYSGTEVPPEISIPLGTIEITWRSDYSVSRAGWEFIYEFLRFDDVGIQVPPSALPLGATDLLVISNSSGGEMASGVATPLVDYNPPAVVPHSVQCQDNDNSIGFIEGICTITRASDETGATSYEIFWGNATNPLSATVGSVALAGASGSELTVSVSRFAVDARASHLLALAAGPGGVAARGASTPLVDNIGLSLSVESVEVLGTPNSTTNQTITVTSESSNDVILSIQLDLEDGSATSRVTEEDGVSFSESAPSSTSMPAICLEGGSRVTKSRLIFKMKGAAVTGRRLEAHARKLESRHGAKVKSFPRLGGLGIAEIKNASVESYCRLFTELNRDPLVDFVEEDQMLHALGNSIPVQPEYDLFPPGGKVPVPEVSRRGHMHRRAPQCHLGACEGGTATHANDDSYDELWGLHQDSDFDIDAPEAWNIHKGLSGQVIVAVIDTGVDYNHEDLRNQMWRNPGEIPGDGIDNDGNGFVDDVYGYDFYENDGDPMDTNGHGTHCAGTIGAEGGNSIGVVGVTWKPQIMALRFLGPNGGSTTSAIQAIDYAVAMGAHLTSNSWGGGGYSQALVDAIEAAGAANQVFIVAAGNDGRDNEITPTFPCNYNLPNMICVASTDSDGYLSSFSNWGVNVVHIAAPGERIHSTYLSGDYQTLSGTSMATPHVAGVAALLLDYIPSLQAAVLKQLILDSAVKFSKFASKVSTGAHLNAHAALVMASQYSWIRMSGSAISAGNITIPAQSSTAISLQLGGNGLDHGEYRARLRMSGTFNGVVYTQIIPILYTVHDFAALPVFGAAALQFEDTDGRRQMISGALTVTRATPEQEATFSQYHIFWAGSAQTRLSDVPLAALDTGNVLHDNFATFDPSFWSGPNGEADSGSSFGSSANWSVSDGAAVFSSQYPHAHLTLARRFAPPFTVRTKVKKTAGALAQMVVEIGGSSANLFGQGGIRAVFFGSQKVLITPEGQHESVPCTLGTWFEVTIIVLQNSVTFQDNQGCATIVKTLAITEATKSIRIGADCTGECASAGGSVWDYFEISGGLYATFNVPENTAIPVDATGFVAHGWNVLGLSSTSLYLPLSDHRVANRASQPTDVQGSLASTNSLTVSWTRGGLNDCTGFFMRYEVVAQSADSTTWVDAAGCQGLVSQTAENCVATGLTSDTPYQFKVRILCSLGETQSLWSEISAAAVTLPLPAVAPTQLRVRLPGSSTLLVSWQSGLLNDCEFVESLVEGQQVGQATWFQPQGCTGLTLLNAYHCTAEALTPGTEYVFRVKTSCADVRSSSSWSATSIPESTLATVQAWESNLRRLISINIASDLDYSQVASNADSFKSSIATQTAHALSVDASQVKVEIMAGEAADPSSGRRLAEVSVVFAVTVEGASQGESETSNQVIAGVASAVEAETGSASTLSVASTSTLTPAIAPEKITWSYAGDGRLKLNWKPLPLGDCSFLAWHVLVNAGGSATLVSGCTNLMNLSHTECVAAGMDGSQSNSFTVGVLCANPAANSVHSEASDAWPSFASTTGASGSGSGQPTTAPVLCETIASLSSVGASAVSQKFGDQLELQVTTALSPCAANPNVELKTSWQYDSSGWTSLESAGLQDSSPLPNTLRFPAFTLLPGSHQFRAVLKNGNTQLDTVTFLVVITDSLPSFKVTGASVVGAGCGVSLQVQKTGVLHPDATLAYSWDCLQAAGACSSISNFAAGQAKSRTLHIEPEETPVGNYTFRATVTKTYGGNMANLPSLSAYVEVTVAVEEGGPLPVEITAPWSRSQRISQQVSELWFPIMASVGGVGSDCQVPTGAVFKWVIAREADDRIMAGVFTLVSRAGGAASVTTLGYEGNSLTPSTSYVYAVLRAQNADTLAAGASSESLQAAAALGISITKSDPFIVDAAPSPGSVEILPLQGQALKTSFSFSTTGWVDEDVASLQYAFFVFPVGDSYTVSLGENGELQSAPPFQPPTLNFESANNPAFWSKMDGLMLRSSATSPTVSQRLSSKAFFTVVRATDQLGATASTTVLGPLVEIPSDVSQEDLTNALAESQNSGDPSQILASVQVVLSVSGDSGSSGSGAVADAALDALAGVTEIVEGDDQTLQQLGDSVSQVVATGNLDAESLEKAADILDSCLDLASGPRGLSVEVGSSILGGIATIGKTSSTATTATGEAKSVSTKLVSLVSNLGEAALGAMEPGQTKEINSVDESGEGIKVAVSKPSTAAAATSGLQLKQLSIAAEAFAGRRLDGLCQTLSVQVTEWLKSNPFSYTEEVLGTTASVSEKADVLSVEMNYCNRSALTTPISVTIPMPDFGDSDLIPTCARFDKAVDSWVTSDVETQLNATVGTVTCSSRFTVTSYTVFGAGSLVTTVAGAGDEETDHSPLSSRIATMVFGCLVFLTAGV